MAPFSSTAELQRTPANSSGPNKENMRFVRPFNDYSFVCIFLRMISSACTNRTIWFSRLSIDFVREIHFSCSIVDAFYSAACDNFCSFEMSKQFEPVKKLCSVAFSIPFKLCVASAWMMRDDSLHCLHPQREVISIIASSAVCECIALPFMS